MVELVVLGALAVAAMMVFGVLGAMAAFVWWIVVLPFKLLGLLFRGAVLLMMLPFLLIAGIFVFGIGVFAFLTPALPLVLLILGVVWLVRRQSRRAAPVAR